MLLTLTTTHRPATDLGYLLHKHPDRCQSLDLPFGRAHVFYPEAGEESCTAALLLDVDPVGLVRGRGATLDQYVNDRPYVASSFLSVAIARFFGTALGGRCPQRPELAAATIPLEARLPVLPCRGGEGFLRGLFEPLGYDLTALAHPLDPTVPAWGESRYFDVTLRAEARLADLLSHLYVLVPVLDEHKHYWVGDSEVDKLLRHGEGWLDDHPMRDGIAHRYLKRQRGLTRSALAQLDDMTEENPAGDEPDPAPRPPAATEPPAAVEKTPRLHDWRLRRVAGVIADHGATSVIDLGCGDGKLLMRLVKNGGLERIVGLDAAPRALEIAARRLHLDELPPHRRGRVSLIQGSVTYRDQRMAGFDAAALVEVIEHLEPQRLPALAAAVFGFAQPALVVVTTPNAEFNIHYENLAGGTLRHPDHRFEWTRAEFAAWAAEVAARYGYQVEIDGIGDSKPNTGASSQLAVFRRAPQTGDTPAGSPA